MNPIVTLFCFLSLLSFVSCQQCGDLPNCPLGKECETFNSTCVAVSCDADDACPSGQVCIPDPSLQCVRAPCPRFHCEPTDTACGGDETAPCRPWMLCLDDNDQVCQVGANCEGFCRARCGGPRNISCFGTAQEPVECLGAGNACPNSDPDCFGFCAATGSNNNGTIISCQNGNACPDGFFCFQSFCLEAQPCGPNDSCPEGFECNSENLCEPPLLFCTQDAIRCADGTVRSRDPLHNCSFWPPCAENVTYPCGGIMATPCPEGMICMDDTSDSCDMLKEGPYCPGLCVVTCESMLACGFNQTCVPDPVCQNMGICPHFTCEPGCEPDMLVCGDGIMLPRDPSFGCRFRECPVPEVCPTGEEPQTCSDNSVCNEACEAYANATDIHCFVDGCNECSAKWVDMYGRVLDCRPRHYGVQFWLRFRSDNAEWFKNQTEDVYQQFTDEIAEACGVESDRIILGIIQEIALIANLTQNSSLPMILPNNSISNPTTANMNITAATAILVNCTILPPRNVNESEINNSTSSSIISNTTSIISGISSVVNNITSSTISTINNITSSVISTINNITSQIGNSSQASALRHDLNHFVPLAAVINSPEPMPMEAFFSFMEKYRENNGTLQHANVSQRLDYTYLVPFELVEVIQCDDGNWSFFCNEDGSANSGGNNGGIPSGSHGGSSTGGNSNSGSGDKSGSTAVSANSLLLMALLGALFLP